MENLIYNTKETVIPCLISKKKDYIIDIKNHIID